MYLGTYVSNATGNLVFQEGPLVTAVRKGHWVVLDELNLAPSEVLEMLNRLLDDNRELMVPNTQKVISVILISPFSPRRTLPACMSAPVLHAFAPAPSTIQSSI